MDASVSPCGLVTEVRGPEGEADEHRVRSDYEVLTRILIRCGITITTMESCTSGQVASLITDTEGSSAVFPGGYVTYSNREKIRLGVPASVIDRFGVYSPETALAMAGVCREAFGTDLGIGITGSFGNADPGNADSVPGEVWFALSDERENAAFHCTVPPQPSRLAYKLYMAQVIVTRLLDRLKH